MKPEIKKLWVDALRSGVYKQGRGRLTSINEDGQQYDCCLGVLCKLAIAAGVELIVRVGDTYIAYQSGAELNSGTLPLDVVKWAGLSNPNPVVVSSPFTIVEHNDGGKFPSGLPSHSFTQIADLIEADKVH